MKKNNYVIEEISKLPPGFRFQPTDEELLFQYLRCKIFSLPLPASIIPEVRFSKLDPWELPGDSFEERYIFTKKGAKNKNGDNRARRATHLGYWEVIGSDEHISPPPNQNLGMMMMGVKKTLVYHLGKSRNSGPTNWFMHEYSLVLNDHMMNSNAYYKNYERASKMEDWIICRVYFSQLNEEHDDAHILDYNDPCSLTQCPCSSSSSSSSSITAAISNELQSDEESSYYP